SWYLYRPHSQGRKARRPPGATSHKNRIGTQPQGRQSARPHHPGNTIGHRRRGDSMIGRRTFTLAAGAAALPILSRITWAQAYPSTCQAPASTKFKNVEYKSGGLRIAAHLYAPEGVGRFPVVIYNHGSRANQRKSEPFQYIGDLFS